MGIDQWEILEINQQKWIEEKAYKVINDIKISIEEMIIRGKAKDLETIITQVKYKRFLEIIITKSIQDLLIMNIIQDINIEGEMKENMIEEGRYNTICSF